MKIIYYSPHPYLNLSSPSGYGTHMREMIAGFEKSGHQVIPLIAGGVDQPKVHLNPNSGTSKIKSLLKKLIPKIIWETLKDYRLIEFDKKMKSELLSLIEKENPDLIYERGNYMQSSGVDASKEKAVVHFLELNAPYVKERVELQGKSWLCNRAIPIEKQIIEKADKVFVISTSLKEYFEETHGISKDKIMAIPNAINPEKFVSNKNLSNKIKAQYKIEKDDVVIGFVGSILRWHGVDILINAFNEIQSVFANAKLMIVGSGEVFDELNQLVRDLRIDEKVFFTGNVPHDMVPSYVDVMDITVIAKTNWYCSPIKIFEYAAMNKAVVASNHPPVVEVMDDHKHGLIIESNYRALALALKELIESPELRKALAHNFYEKTLKEHTWISNSQKVLDCYSQQKMQGQ